jgi:DNA-binding response OmpR family regulator
MSATILYIDDNRYMLDLISRMLEIEGYKVLSASDGLTGLSMIADNNPDVVLVDIAMPILNGHEVCKLIRQQPTFEQLPLVMLTTSYGLDDQIAARNNQVNGYLTKPCSRQELVYTIERLVKTSRNRIIA